MFCSVSCLTFVWDWVALCVFVVISCVRLNWGAFCVFVDLSCVMLCYVMLNCVMLYVFIELCCVV